jgi:hypothetical protein
VELDGTSTKAMLYARNIGIRKIDLNGVMDILL